jgi:hypothetical protein
MKVKKTRISAAHIISRSSIILDHHDTARHDANCSGLFLIPPRSLEIPDLLVIRLHGDNV